MVTLKPPPWGAPLPLSRSCKANPTPHRVSPRTILGGSDGGPETPGPGHSLHRLSGHRPGHAARGQRTIRRPCSERHPGGKPPPPAVTVWEGAEHLRGPRRKASAPHLSRSVARAQDARERRGARWGGCRGGGSAGTAGPGRLQGERRREKGEGGIHPPQNGGADAPGRHTPPLLPPPLAPGTRPPRAAGRAPRAGARPSPPVAVGVAVRGGAGPAGAGAGRDSSASARGPAGHGRRTHLGRARGAGRGGGAAE